MNPTPTDRDRRIDPRAMALSDALQLVGRLMIAPLYLLSGFAKLSAPDQMLAYIDAAALPFPAVALGVAILVELIGGALLVVGYKVRAVAAIMALFTLATAIIFHNQLADQTQFLFFFKNIAIIGGLLQLVALGGGRWSIDNI
ncbi:DoxX family protein [Sphingobium sp.]|uniref:DoxX family protein n=1 Tax=Sphingobium sp. TaxID=1912891 RepID=UPI003B3B2AE7